MFMQQKTLNARFVGGKIKVINLEKNAQIKSNKIPSHITTLEIFKEEPSIEAIAAKRELSFGTIVGHIEKLISLKLFDQNCMKNLKNTILEYDFDVIFAELEQSEDGRLKPIYDKLNGKYPYELIQLVRLFLSTDIIDAD